MASDGLEILLKMAQNGAIDPWNIHIVDVADEYLKRVGETRAQNLKLTGKTLLYLAILLRMKSDHLAGIDFLAPLEDFPEPVDEGFENPYADVIQAALDNVVPFRRRTLDDVIVRRTSTKQPRRRPVTLADLIEEIQKIEAEEVAREIQHKIERHERRRRRVIDFADWTPDDIENLAHEEFSEEAIDTVYAAFTAATEVPVPLDALVAATQLDAISVYLALLFLSAREQVVLHQPSFYGPLMVAHPEPSDPV
jgi:segregation and condensation protein A